MGQIGSGSGRGRLTYIKVNARRVALEVMNWITVYMYTMWYHSESSVMVTGETMSPQTNYLI